MNGFVQLIGALILAGLLSYGFSRLVRIVSLRTRTVDSPDTSRKFQNVPVPLMGGIGIFLAIAAVTFLLALLNPGQITDAHVTWKQFTGLFLGAVVLLIGGTIDDKYGLKPYQQIIAPLLAIAVVIACGIGVKEITNPLSKGTINLSSWNILLFWWDGLPRYFTVFADILTFVWLLGMMYTTKLLDGLDGLVSGVTVIGAGIVAVVSMVLFINEPTALLAAITAGSFAGFLLLNLPPARMYLGEGGSLLAGYMLGVLSILSGAKFATALLVIGIPILDAARVIVERIRSGQSPFSADRRHLHFRLQHLGLSPRQALAFYLLTAVGFGCTALLLQRFEKLIAISILVLFAIGFFVFIKRKEGGRTY